MKTSEHHAQAFPRGARLLLDNLEELIAALLVSVIGIVLAGQVAFRTVFQTPLSWPEELSQFLFVWASLLGAVGATKRAQLVRFDNLLNAVPARARAGLEHVGRTAILVFLGVLCWKAVQLGMRTSFAATTLPITWAWAYAAVPVFCVASAVRLLQGAVFGYRFLFIENALAAKAGTEAQGVHA